MSAAAPSSVVTGRTEGDPHLRVLHVHSGNLYGGVETFLSTLARQGTTAPAVVSDFALCFDGRLRRELVEAGATVHMVGAVRARSPRTVFTARAAFARALKSGAYDVVVNHSAWAHGIFAPVARDQGSRLVYYMHDLPRRLGWLYQWADRTPPDRVLCNSDFTAASAQWLFREVPRRVVRLPMAFARADGPTRAATRGAMGVDDGTVVILLASRMQSLKGHGLLIEALARLRSRTKWVCWLAGGTQRASEEQYAERLRKAVRRHRLLERVQFLGERRDVPDLMSAADVYCQPNLTPESFGLSFVEALASGKPVVTTRMGGAVEIVTPPCGVLVPPRPGPLVEALASLIDDADLRSALAANGPQRAYELCGTHARLAELAAELLSLRPRAGRG